MDKTFDQRYKDVVARYSEDAMKAISAELIEAYQKTNLAVLNRYASRLGMERQSDRKVAGRLFAKLIMNYHPDRRQFILKELEDCRKRRDFDALDSFERAMADTSEKDSASAPYDDFVYEEEYSVDEEDLFSAGGFGEYGSDGYGEGDFGGEDLDDEDLGSGHNAPRDFDADDFDRERRREAEETTDEYEGEFGFIEALRAEMYGNLDFTLLPKDLIVLEGEIVLRGRNIEDLVGIEYCTGVSAFDLSWNSLSSVAEISGLDGLRSLDLSHNQIEDVSALSTLSGLEMLDLSHNDIEDVSDLTALTNLRYLNVLGNPIQNRAPLAVLRAMGVVVIE